MKRASLEPLVDKGTNLVESAKGHVEQALDTADSHLRELLEAGATRATTGLDRVDKAAPVITIDRRSGRSRRWLFLVVVVALGAIGAWLWSRRGASHADVARPASTVGRDDEAIGGPRYEVMQATEGGWNVVGPSGSSENRKTQAEAIDAAKRIASSAGGGEVVVHGLDGKPRTTLSVPRSA